jgi:hypothetical protein
MKYEDSPSRCRTRFTEISAYWDHGPAASTEAVVEGGSTLARATGLRELER